MSSQETRGISSSSTKILRAAALFFFLITATFYIATVRAGDYWGDDFALYVHHAMNIASGVPYAHTGYLFNPLTPDYSPLYYPPVFPITLSVVCWFWGLDWHALKVEQSVFLLLAILAIWLYFRRWLSPWLALLLAAAVAWNPQVYLFHDLLVAEPLFLCLLFLSLERIERVFDKRPKGRTLRDSLVLGVLFYLCFGCRSAGLMLIPGAWAFAIVRRRRIPGELIIATAVSLAGYLLQKLILGPDLYMAQFHPTMAVVAANVYSYLSVSQEPWNPGLGLITTHTIAGVMWALAGLGIFSQIRQRTLGNRAIEWFALPYLAVILAWPASQGFRFLLPLFPLFVFYLIEGGCWIASRLTGVQASWRRAAIALVILFTVSYPLTYWKRVSFGRIGEAEGSPAFSELCAYIHENSSPDSRFLFSRARLLSLLTDRAALTSDRTHDFPRMWSVLEREGVRYICFARVLPDDEADLAPLVSLEAKKLKPVFTNGDFTLYEILNY